MKVWLKLLVKDFRRIKWPKSKKLLYYFLLTIVFVVVVTGFLFSVDFLFTMLWNKLHIGING